MMNMLTGKLQTLEDNIKQSIECLLKTAKGERVLNRNFGTNLYKLMDEPINLVKSKVLMEVLGSIMKFETRIENVEVSIYKSPHNSEAVGNLTVDVSYTIKSNGNKDKLNLGI
jgi:phage baseplate assembly protein W